MDNDFLHLCDVISTFSTCERRKIGTVITNKSGDIVSVGFNRPDGKSCTEMGGCIKNKEKIKSGKGHSICRAVHSEVIAIKGMVGRVGYTLYNTYSPCLNCSNLIIKSGIKRVVVRELYPDKDAIILLKKHLLFHVFNENMCTINITDMSMKKFWKIERNRINVK